MDPLGFEAGKKKTKPYWPPWIEPFVPGYEEYGGPMRTDPTLRTKPKDSMDEIFKEHDKGWPSKEADKKVLKDLWNLPPNPRNWPEPAANPVWASMYRTGAETYFFWSNFFTGN